MVWRMLWDSDKRQSVPPVFYSVPRVQEAMDLWIEHTVDPERKERLKKAKAERTSSSKPEKLCEATFSPFLLACAY